MSNPIIEFEYEINDQIQDSDNPMYSENLMRGLISEINQSNKNQDGKINDALNNGFNINIVDWEGNNMLYFLKNINWPQTLNCLIQNGIDMYHINNHKQASVFNIGRSEMFDVLIQNNFDILFKDQKGQDFDSVVQYRLSNLQSMNPITKNNRFDNHLAEIKALSKKVDYFKKIALENQELKQQTGQTKKQTNKLVL